jgi:hypothetical protein
LRHHFDHVKRSPRQIVSLHLKLHGEQLPSVKL